MSGVPYVFGNATTSIPLSQLDVNFATNATIGTTSVGLGNTTTTLVGLTNVSTTVVNTSNVSANTSLLLQTNGTTTAVTIDTSQNVGIGLTPNTWTGALKALQIGSTASLAGGSGEADLYCNAYNNGTNIIYQTSSYASQFQMNNLGEFRWYNAPSGTAGNAITFTQAMTLNANGILLVGATTTNANAGGAKFQVSQANNNWISYIENTNASGNIYCQFLRFSNQSPNNATSLFTYMGDNVGQKMSVLSNGGIANYSANNSNLSDRREKTNFAPAKSYLDVICSIPVQTYNYIDQNMKEDAGLTLGVVAQDVQAVAPELVTESDWSTEKDGSKMRLSIYQTDMQYALMKCIQELSAQVTTLQTQVTALQTKVGV